ncbi:MAG: hypothetical protein HY260_09580, partial [Chloroflexi bacterium]|nr:hypothetical protein [Chloroflexota bacterium]
MLTRHPVTLSPRHFVTFLAFLFSLAFPALARADGIVIIDPPPCPVPLLPPCVDC